METFLPFAVASIPAAFIGGYIHLEADFFFLIVGFVLLLMASAIIIKAYGNFDDRDIITLIFGTGIGFLSGLIGVGGGIFLSPIILLLGWGSIRQIAAITALFVLVNSLSGLTGHLFTMEIL